MIQKNPRKKNPLLIPILVLLFLGSLAYAVYDAYGPFKLKKEIADQKKIIPEYFDFGVITDSTYCNDFFAFRIPIPNGYEGNYKRYDYIEKSIYERDSIPAAPKLANDIMDQELFIIEPKFVKMDAITMLLKEKKTMEDISAYMREKTQRDNFGADYKMAVSVHKLSGASLQSYTKQFQNLYNPNYGHPKTKIVSGISFQELHGMEQNGADSPGKVMFQMLGGTDKNIISLNTVIHDFAFSIDLYYQTEEQKCILLEMVDSINFHS